MISVDIVLACDRCTEKVAYHGMAIVGAGVEHRRSGRLKLVLDVPDITILSPIGWSTSADGKEHFCQECTKEEALV